MAVTWQASWPPTRSRHEDRQPPDSNSSGVLGPARRGRGTVGDDLCVRPNHAALDPHERPVHWPSPRARSWCSDGSPAKAASRSPARSSRSATATPAGPSPCSSLAQSDQRIDRPLFPERAPSGRLASGTRGQAGLGGQCWCPRRPPARTGVQPPSAQEPPVWKRGGRYASPAAIAARATHGRTPRPMTAATAGHGRSKCGEHGWCPGRYGRPSRPCRNATSPLQTLPDTADGLPRPQSTRAAAVARGTGHRTGSRGRQSDFRMARSCLCSVRPRPGAGGWHAHGEPALRRQDVSEPARRRPRHTT
jgi:hypothetical protein